MQDVYERLRAHLDQFSTGFPATKSGIEIKILKQLFTETQAEFFLQLSPMLETPVVIAARLERDPEEIAEILEQMAQKGLLFRQRKGDLVRYAAPPYVVGIYEYQVNHMDRQFAKDMEAYFKAGFGRKLQAYKTPMMRTIPINREITAQSPVAPYEDVVKIIQNQEKIAISPCVCRAMHKLNEKACEKPIDNCFSFGSHADYYVENGIGRYVETAEALEIVKQSEAEGLVMQPFNAQKIGGMCSCCGDCCGILRSLKLQPSPADAVQSNYFAECEADECIGCEICIERCQMEAIDMVEDTAKVILNRCIGCGLCVTTCSTGAMQLIKKPDSQQYTPPKSGLETYLNIARERGKIPGTISK